MTENDSFWLVDEVAGVRIERISRDPSSLVTVQIKIDARGWLDFFRLRWGDLANGNITMETVGPAYDDRSRIAKAVSMAAMKYERERLSSMYSGGG